MTNEAEHSDRRKHRRVKAKAGVRASQVVPAVPLSDVEVLDVSASGIAIRTRVALRVGERLSFRLSAASAKGATSRLNAGDQAPILAEVLSCEAMSEGEFRVRCRALLGAFEAA
ncbi:MAG: PilZ domain-containing protein [Phycisphaeraceae bacterium]